MVSIPLNGFQKTLYENNQEPVQFLENMSWKRSINLTYMGKRSSMHWEMLLWADRAATRGVQARTDSRLYQELQDSIGMEVRLWKLKMLLQW